MPRTPLHSALGSTSTALTFDLVLQACADKVRERDSIDWKQQLPLAAASGDRSAKEHRQSELAKDVAAMANSGGGMIIFGVAEVREAGTSAADHVVPVGVVTEDHTRDIRRVAANLIYPPVTGLGLVSLHPDGRPGDGVLVLLIPDSPDRPHLILSKNGDWFGSPYRHGPDTQWMVERQIADAYRAREQARGASQSNFEERASAFAAACNARSGEPWITIVAVPNVPLRNPRDLRLDQADSIIRRAWTWPWSSSLGPRDLTFHEPTRRGLRRHRREGSRRLGRFDATPRARVEVYGDGSVAVGFTRDGALPNGHGQVAIVDIEQTGKDFFALLWETRSAMGVTADYTARIAISPATQVFRRLDPVVDDFQPFDESHRVTGYEPVDGPIIADGGLESALISWMDLVHDAVSQAGVSPTIAAEDLYTALQLGS